MLNAYLQILNFHDSQLGLCYFMFSLEISSKLIIFVFFYYTVKFKLQKIQVIRRNQVYFSSFNVSTDTTVIAKD